VLNYIPFWSHAAEKYWKHFDNLIQKKQAAPNCPQKKLILKLPVNSDILVESDVIVYSIHIVYEGKCVTPHTLVGVQRWWWTVVIELHQLDNTHLGRNTVTWRSVRVGHQHSTQHSPTVFSWDLFACFIKVNKTWEYIFGILPKFLENFLGSENLDCSALAKRKTSLSIIQLWLN